MLRSILYWKLLFKPFPYKSFGWCNAHSVQADALWGRSFKFQMKTHHKINTSLLMLREWTYTASSRDALGNTSLLSAVYGYNKQVSFLGSLYQEWSHSHSHIETTHLAYNMEEIQKYIAAFKYCHIVELKHLAASSLVHVGPNNWKNWKSAGCTLT